MPIKIIIITFIVHCTFSISVFAGDKLNFRVVVPQNINTKKVLVSIENGLEFKIIEPIFINNQCIITEKVYSKVASISLSYPIKSGELWGVTLLVPHSATTSVRFDVVKDSNTNQFSKYSLTNCTNAYKCREYYRLQSYCKVLTDSNKYYSAQYNKINNDSILALYNLSSVKLAVKQMEFIKTHGEEYYYFWFFRANIANSLLPTHQIELYETFNTAFPAKFKESKEGENLKTLIAGRLFIKKGNNAPTFDVEDYLGNKVSSEKLRGKFVLMNFWATWCSPCIDEIPMLKKIRDTYSKEKLEMISVSLDNNLTAFKKGINKYELNWINIFSNTNLQNLFGKKPIPSVYLIDPNGILLFSSWEDDFDTLHTLLAEKIKSE